MKLIFNLNPLSVSMSALNQQFRMLLNNSDVFIKKWIPTRGKKHLLHLEKRNWIIFKAVSLVWWEWAKFFILHRTSHVFFGNRRLVDLILQKTLQFMPLLRLFLQCRALNGLWNWRLWWRVPGNCKYLDIDAGSPQELKNSFVLNLAPGLRRVKIPD